MSEITRHLLERELARNHQLQMQLGVLRHYTEEVISKYVSPEFNNQARSELHLALTKPQDTNHAKIMYDLGV